MTTKPALEPAAQEFADATANPPFLFDLGPEKGREVVDDVQSGEIAKPDVDITDTTVSGGPLGAVSVRILRPRGSTGPPAGDRLHPRRGLGLRQRTHARSADP